MRGKLKLCVGGRQVNETLLAINSKKPPSKCALIFYNFILLWFFNYKLFGVSAFSAVPLFFVRKGLRILFVFVIAHGTRDGPRKAFWRL